MRVKCTFVPTGTPWFSLDKEYDCEEKAVGGSTTYFVKVLIGGDESFSVTQDEKEITIETPPAGTYDAKLEAALFNEIFEVIG